MYIQQVLLVFFFLTTSLFSYFTAGSGFNIYAIQFQLTNYRKVIFIKCECDDGNLRGEIGQLSKNIQYKSGDEPKTCTHTNTIKWSSNKSAFLHFIENPCIYTFSLFYALSQNYNNKNEPLTFSHFLYRFHHQFLIDAA